MSPAQSPPAQSPAVQPSPDVLSDVAARSSGLHERMCGAVEVLPLTPAAYRRAERLLQRWRDEVGRGDNARFARRLRQDRLDEPAALRLLGDVRWPDGAPLPAWMDTLTAVTHEAAALAERDAATTGGVVDRVQSSAAPLPFEELLLPFVRHARKELAERVAEAMDDWHGAAITALERDLLRRLADCAQTTFLGRFTAYRSGARGASRRPNAVYRAFVRSVWEGGLVVYADYPVLARLLCQETRNWIDAAAETAIRLRRDRPALQAAFGRGGALGAVVDVRTGASDPHRGGRTVATFRFSTGTRLVYKPRSLALDAAYRQVVDWLTDAGAPHRLQAPDSLCRRDRTGDYGWQAYVDAGGCHSAADVERYYQRCGALLAVMHVLSGRDFHGENLIASGAQPVPVDLEMVAAPRLARRHELRSAPAAARALEHTVLETGFLPWQQAHREGPDLSGFVASDVQRVTVTEWHRVNTDRMHRTRGERPVRHDLRNVPTLHGRRVDPSDFTAFVARGFEDTYRFIADCRDALAAGPLRALDGLPVRYLLRDTRTYGRVLRAAWHPHCLRDGAAFSIQIDALSAGLLTVEPSAALWQAFEGERDEMHCGDVPLLTTTTTATDLQREDGGHVAGFFETPGTVRVHHRLRSLSETDLHAQTTLLRTAFATAARTHTAHADAAMNGADEAGEAVRRSWPPRTRVAGVAEQQIGDGDLFLNAAVRLRRSVLDQAIQPAGAAAPTWVTVAYDARRDRYALQPLDESLHSGRAGIALTAAAEFVATGTASARTDALRLLRALADRIGDGAPHRLRSVTSSLGATTGWGGLLTVLAHTGTWLDAPDLHAAARRAAAGLDVLARPVVEADPANVAMPDVDLAAGLAGAVVGLLCAYDGLGDAVFADRAIRFGDALLEMADDENSALSDPDCVLGLAHGLAGVAFAFARCRRAAPPPVQDRLGDACRRLWRVVDEHYDASRHNWPREGGADASAEMRGWCHGSTGIGIAALGTLQGWEDADAETRALLHRTLDRAVRAEMESDCPERDHLCCGAWSRVALLADAGAYAPATYPHAAADAHRRARFLVTRADRRGGYRSIFDTSGSRSGTAGFFTGASGVGYELLRHSHRAVLPSVTRFSACTPDTPRNPQLTADNQQRNNQQRTTNHPEP